MSGTAPGPGRDEWPDDDTDRGGGTALDAADPGTPHASVPTLADYDEEPAAKAHRFWSTRRIPAALTALVTLGATGLLLYDVAAVRAGHPAMSWRRGLADQLARQPLDQTWMLVAAAVAMALGVWLLALALTPGLRALLPMRRDSPHVRAGLDREAAELALRDRAMEVSGVQSAQVRLRRSKAVARAVSHFRELDAVQDDLERTLTAGIGELGLDRRPALTVRVRRPVRKG
ncbi:DUF6286 domain-containing protein [Streptomyces corynorhini]|uniref:DUF6286 domain-containing protein n=1 Tax=Streptomyces corynorhini TaxID=2282652 RepID=A0A370BGF5_9ACTN|nr:DUF6286 domain-containing protein [Streptomyces corynorhini]RDG39354.1 hypothetical protein DVH02_04320 [Streptomyces corynorhini]